MFIVTEYAALMWATFKGNSNALAYAMRRLIG